VDLVAGREAGDGVCSVLIGATDEIAGYAHIKCHVYGWPLYKRSTQLSRPVIMDFGLRPSAGPGMTDSMVSKDTLKTSVDHLTEAQAKAEHARLEAEIGGHDRRYYEEDAPTVSDAEYDKLRQRYSAIEARFPQLRTPASLTQRVGAAPSARFAKVRHAVPMLSLDNAFGEDDVRDFVGRIRRFLRLAGDEEIAFSAEPKIDGLSMSLLQCSRLRLASLWCHNGRSWL